MDGTQPANTEHPVYFIKKRLIKGIFTACYPFKEDNTYIA